ncbi:MAG: hypothetical protein JWN03_711 [Nocardia sp.]|nr:hypothetical protein [Nocardia sp.]
MRPAAYRRERINIISPAPSSMAALEYMRHHRLQTVDVIDASEHFDQPALDSSNLRFGNCEIDQRRHRRILTLDEALE